MAMTVPVLLAIIDINYRSTDRVVRNHALKLVETFRSETLEDIAAEFRTLSGHIAATAELGRQAPELLAEAKSLGYLFRVLEHGSTALNVYVGLEDGSFRQARRIADITQPILGKLPPPEAKFAYRLLEPVADEPVLDRYIFLDAGQEVLGEVSEVSGYDPRQRAWYRQAAAAGTTMMTDPEVFWALGLVGFSIAAPFRNADGVLGGVVAVDVTLDGFSDYLAGNPLSANSASYLLDEDGNVLAASDRAAVYGSENNAVDLTHVAELGSRLVGLAYANRPSDASEVFPYEHDGEEYIAGLSYVDDTFGKRWRLLTVTPLSDFTGNLSQHNRQMVVFGLGAVAIQLLVIYLMASRVSSPLRSLAAKVERIQALEPGADLPPVRSSVREIAALSRAIETLDIAVQAFARFVPVGLVRQLLTSEQKLEIGGQSKFLTIFFSDMEGFSGLAERMASRALLDRISTMLELVSKCVHHERGTIDKFVGDGVMAFWGAPTPLEDHAWHACVAALRIQRVLGGFNEAWRDESAPEMRLRIGIHSDAVLVGNVGSQERMSYTVLGDGVNIAARLETLNKDYGTLICISHDTFREAGDRLCVRPIDEVAVKGRRARIAVYELLGAYGAGQDLEPTPKQAELAALTRSAFDAMTAGDRQGALALYRRALAVAPDDRVAQVQIARLSETGSLSVTGPSGSEDAGQGPAAVAFRPSVHSAAVVRQLILRQDRLRGARVLDIGCGSGVLLATAGKLGATQLTGVDIEPGATRETARTLEPFVPGVAVEIALGYLYEPFAGRRFDVVLANLPHFPMESASLEGRLATWSGGGGDGRRLLDLVISGLGAHLAPGGCAIVAHNAFVGLEATRELLLGQGLSMSVVDTVLIPLPPEKSALITPDILDREMGRTIHRFGGHVFAEVAVLLIEGGEGRTG